METHEQLLKFFVYDSHDDLNSVVKKSNISSISFLFLSVSEIEEPNLKILIFFLCFFFFSFLFSFFCFVTGMARSPEGFLVLVLVLTISIHQAVSILNSHQPVALELFSPENGYFGRSHRL